MSKELHLWHSVSGKNETYERILLPDEPERQPDASPDEPEGYEVMDRRALILECETRQKEIGSLQSTLGESEDEVVQLKLTNDKLRGALAYYAARGSWISRTPGARIKDLWNLMSSGFEIAEEALSHFGKLPVWGPDDKPIDEDDEIRAAHPTRSKDKDRHDRYAEAIRMVGAKFSKYAIVDLVNWLLKEAQEAIEDKRSFKKGVLSMLEDVNNSHCRRCGACQGKVAALIGKLRQTVGFEEKGR